MKSESLTAETGKFGRFRVMTKTCGALNLPCSPVRPKGGKAADALQQVFLVSVIAEAEAELKLKLKDPELELIRFLYTLGFSGGFGGCDMTVTR